MTYGVPQGSVLGPTLFLIYINDLCNMKLKNAKIFSYADDTALVFMGDSWDSVRRDTEEGLRQIYTWLNANVLTLNTDKTNYICFSLCRNSQLSQNFTVQIHDCIDQLSCNCPHIQKLTQTKYLGVLLDQRLFWHPQIEYVMQSVRKLTWIFKSLRHVVLRVSPT